MTELKTLKDLGREREIYDLDTGRLKGWDRVLYFNDVKAEAIKWVKYFKSCVEEEMLKENVGAVSGFLGIIGWIKEFHNITEDDLNE